MICRNCDTRNDDTARFCRVCGTAFATPTPAPQPRPVYTITDAPMSGPGCGACGRANPPGARYCVYCASALGASAAPVWQPAYAGGSTITAPPLLMTSPDLSNLLIRAIWFFFVGWWLGLVWTVFAWLFNLTLIGLPVGAMMLNAIPQIMTLKPRPGVRVAAMSNGHVLVQQRMEQPLALRAIWFVLIGSWASLIWMIIAWMFSASLLFMPIAFWMFDRVPTVTTLAAE